MIRNHRPAVPKMSTLRFHAERWSVAKETIECPYGGGKSGTFWNLWCAVREHRTFDCGHALPSSSRINGCMDLELAADQVAKLVPPELAFRHLTWRRTTCCLPSCQRPSLSSSRRCLPPTKPSCTRPCFRCTSVLPDTHTHRRLSDVLSLKIPFDRK